MSDVRLAHPVTLTRVLRSEWVKFRSLRSTWAVLTAAFVGMIAIGLIVAYNTRHLNSSLQPEDVLPSATLQGYYLGQLLIGALGVLFVSREYTTGMIRSTLASVPRRVPVLIAKVVVFVVIVAVAMIVASFIAFTAAQALLSHFRTGYSLSQPGILRIVVGTGVVLTLMGLFGAVCGWIMRSTPGALVTYFAVALVLPVIFGNVLGTWGKDVAQFLPGSAGSSFISSVPESPSLSPWVGISVLIAWVVVGLVSAAVVLTRRDA